MQRLPATRLRFGAAVLAALHFCGLNAFGAAYRPTGADTVLLELDAGQRETSLALRARRSAEQSHRTDPQGSLALARQFVALGRAQHDERYFGYASALLQPWSLDPQAPAAIVLLRADIAQHQHRFKDAQRILQSLIERHEAGADAWLMSAALHIGQAQPLEARQACQQLFAHRASFAATVCLAHAASLSGNLAGSYALVTNLLDQLAAQDAGSEYAWALGIAAELAERRGEFAEAEKWLRQALALNEQDLVSRLQLCDLLLRDDRAREAMEQLAALPASEPVLLRRALAGQRIGGPVGSATLTAWRNAIERSDDLGVTLHLRELALGQLHLLGEPQAALRTALRNWEVQREPVDARILLQAARAAGDSRAAQAVLAWQRNLGYEDVQLQ